MPAASVTPTQKASPPHTESVNPHSVWFTPIPSSFQRDSVESLKLVTSLRHGMQAEPPWPCHTKGLNRCCCEKGCSATTYCHRSGTLCTEWSAQYSSTSSQVSRFCRRPASCGNPRATLSQVEGPASPQASQKVGHRDSDAWTTHIWKMWHSRHGRTQGPNHHTASSEPWQSHANIQRQPNTTPARSSVQACALQK
jgi:hypothetical protein